MVCLASSLVLISCWLLQPGPPRGLSHGADRKPVSPVVPRRAAILGASALCALSVAGPARAEEDCMATCLRECKQLVPGNDGYCTENCKTACAAIAAKAATDAPVVSQSASVGGSGGPEYVPEVRGSSGSIGIFGRASDNGVERFAATLFGATKQGSDPRRADRDAFVDDVVSSFKTGVLKEK